jgi:hypothetical protein
MRGGPVTPATIRPRPGRNGGSRLAVAIQRVRRCRTCRLEVNPRAAACWFCSTPLRASPTVAPPPARAPVGAAGEADRVAFASGVLAGAAVVLIPLAIRLALGPI